MSNKTYTCIIVDDNPQCISGLRNLIEKYFLEIKILAEADSVASGVNLIKKYDPDILFLDVEMPNENGTALFDYISEPRFKTIFTTAFEDYAAKAFRLNSVDYLLKPIKPSELKDAIAKVKSVIEKESSHHSKIIPLHSQEDKITCTTLDSIEIFTIGDIIYCKAENNYTLIFSNKKKSFVSKTLGHYEQMLSEYGFFRINRSFLINLKYVERIEKSIPEVILINDIRIPISGRRKKQFFEILSGYSE